MFEYLTVVILLSGASLVKAAPIPGRLEDRAANLLGETSPTTTASTTTTTSTTSTPLLPNLAYLRDVVDAVNAALIENNVATANDLYHGGNQRYHEVIVGLAHKASTPCPTRPPCPRVKKCPRVRCRPCPSCPTCRPCPEPQERPAVQCKICPPIPKCPACPTCREDPPVQCPSCKQCPSCPERQDPECPECPGCPLPPVVSKASCPASTPPTPHEEIHVDSADDYSNDESENQIERPESYEEQIDDIKDEIVAETTCHRWQSVLGDACCLDFQKIDRAKRFAEEAYSNQSTVLELTRDDLSECTGELKECKKDRKTLTKTSKKYANLTVIHNAKINAHALCEASRSVLNITQNTGITDAVISYSSLLFAILEVNPIIQGYTITSWIYMLLTTILVIFLSVQLYRLRGERDALRLEVARLEVLSITSISNENYLPHADPSVDALRHSNFVIRPNHKQARAAPPKTAPPGSNPFEDDDGQTLPDTTTNTPFLSFDCDDGELGGDGHEEAESAVESHEMKEVKTTTQSSESATPNDREDASEDATVEHQAQVHNPEDAEDEKETSN